MLEKPTNELILRLKNQDVKALGELFDLLGTSIFNRCMFILKDRMLADDATQDIFLKAFTRIKTLKDQTKLESWVNTICYNHCMDLLRQKKYYSDNEPSEIHDFEENSILEDIDLLQKEAKIQESLQELLSELKEIDRLVIVMHYWEGRTLSEISEELNIGLSAVKMKLVRLRDRLKSGLQQHGIEGIVELAVLFLLFFS